MAPVGFPFLSTPDGGFGIPSELGEHLCALCVALSLSKGASVVKRDVLFAALASWRLAHPIREIGVIGGSPPASLRASLRLVPVPSLPRAVVKKIRPSRP